MTKERVAFTNRWMFNRVLRREDVCRRVLNAALGIGVEKIAYLNVEQVIEPTLSGHGVRMDVYVRDGNRVYDVEMQVARDEDLGRRMRYYQAALDTSELEAGYAYDSLPDSYVVFLCCFDAYGKGDPIYRIERRCNTHPNVEAGDGSPWVVLNAATWERAESEPLQDLLRYVFTEDVKGELSREIDAFVSEYNQDREWVNRVLTFEQDTEHRCRMAKKQGFEQGIEQGIKQGEKRFGTLAERLVELGRADEISAAAHDGQVRKRLLQELGI